LTIIIITAKITNTIVFCAVTRQPFLCHRQGTAGLNMAEGKMGLWLVIALGGKVSGRLFSAFSGQT
jgi:hypothetical protein